MEELEALSHYREAPFQNPTIHFLGIRIDEPITTITDLILVGMLFYYFWRLHKVGNKPGNIDAFLKYFFLTMGIATLSVALLGHGFKYLFNKWWKLPGWELSMVAMVLLQRSAIFYAKPLIHEKLGKFFSVMNLIEVILFMIALAIFLDFYWVVGHSGYGFLVVVGGFNLFTFIKTRSKASFWMLMGVVAAAGVGASYVFTLAIDEWFNHLDLAHIFMMIAAFFVFKGSMIMVDDLEHRVKFGT